MPIRPHGDEDENESDLKPELGLQGMSEEVEDGGKEEDGEVESGEVVMEEELALHDEEGEVVKRPAESEETAKSIVEDNGRCAQASFTHGPV